MPVEPSIKIGSQALTSVPPVEECSLGTPAAQLGGSFGHGYSTHSRRVGVGRDADAVVFYFDGETVVRTVHPDNNPLGAGVFRRVADRLLRDAVGRDFNRRREYREITRNLESNVRRALARPSQH